jgi:hypothetical protein
MILYLFLIMNVLSKSSLQVAPGMNSEFPFLTFVLITAASVYIPLFKLISRYILQTLYLIHKI